MNDIETIREALHTLYAYTSDDANPPGEGRSWTHEQGRAALGRIQTVVARLPEVVALIDELLDSEPRRHTEGKGTWVFDEEYLRELRTSLRRQVRVDAV